MSLTSAEAIALLRSNPDAYTTVDSLRSLANQVDVSATGKVTVLYSGPIASGISTAGVIKGMLANGEDIRVIDKTQAAEFLTSDAFLERVANSFGLILSEMQDPSYRGPATDWLYDATSGPWADASGRFVEATTGEVKTLTPFASPDRTFAQIELPALLENTHVTTVNGVPHEALTALYHEMGGAANSDALLKLQGATGLLSWKATADLDIIKNADGTLLVDAGKFLADGSSSVAPAFTNDMPGKLSGASAMGSLTEANKTALLADIDYLSKIDLAAKGLSKLSTAAAVVDFLLTVNDANAAMQAGDNAKAGSLMAEWTAKFGASMSAGLLAGEIVGSALAPLYLTGPLGAGVAAVLTVGASLGAAMLAATGAEIFISELVGSSFSSAQRVGRDPLILDLDGDGLETVGPTQSNVKFDHDGSGIKTISGWVKPDDGFLVMDRNNNGVIDNGHELFGDATPLYVGGFAADGFAALVQEDTNGDGKVNNTDANWSKLRIWRDLNQDGISQANELFTMSDAGIAGFNVAKTVNSVRLANGNELADLGTYIKTDGATGTLSETSRLGDVNLAQDTFHSQFTDAVPIDADVQQLPSLRGSGLVRELRQAASLDTAAGNALKTKLAAFAAAHSGAEQQAALDDLLLAWADTSPLIPHMQDRNPAQIKVVWSSAEQQAQWENKLHILEAFNGHYFFALPGESQTRTTGITFSTPDSQGILTATVNLIAGQTNQLQQSFDALKESVYDSLVLQTRLQPLLEKIGIDLDADGAHFNLDRINAALKARVADNAIDGLTDWIDLAKYAQPILTGTGFDAWSGLETMLRSDVITTDTLNALHVQVGGANNDWVTGGNADDLLFGGGSNDTLTGGNGNDFYIFHAGDGYDVVNENANAGIDVLQLGAGLDPSKTRIMVENLDLVLAFDTSDMVRISTYFGQNRVEQIRFADGTTWDFATVISKPIIGTAGADKLSAAGGYAGSINGLDGNDTIYGGSGNDTITGGTGSDSLNGGSGNDTYVFNLGDGADTISDNSGDPADVLQFGTGITADTTQLSRSGNDLTFNLGASDQVTIKDYFYPNYTSNYRIETVAFADGTTWNVGTTVGKLTYNGTAGADTMNGDGTYGNHINGLDGNDSISGGGAADALDGGAGNDTIYGFNGNDTITGGTGSDSLNGGSGNDTYVFNLGDGADTISDNSGDPADVLQFGTGITADTTQLSRSGNDLTFNLGASDQVTIKDYFNPNYTSNYRIETVAFADGTTWNVGTTVGKLTYNGTAGTDTMNGDGTYGNHINGLDGNDSISGGGAADALDGGAGNDTIYGFSGNDTITGGTGSDSLNGGSGNDTYVFNLGDGTDTISDNSGDPADVLQFGTGITADTTQLSRSGNDLTFNLGASDQVTIKDYFNPNYTSNYRIETVAFADGTTWNVGTTVGKLTYNGTAGTDTMNGDGTYGNHINGLDGNDSISGGGAADALDGGAGNDTIYGFSGNDTITGGTGSDSLNGGSGNDTYVFNLGDGADTISDNSGDPADVLQFGTGITADTTQLSRSGNDLTFNLGASDQVTIKDYFNPNYTSNYRIETVAFADGTTWNVGTTVGKLTYNGTAGTDTMNGDGAYGNHINGLDGNDSISGGGAADALDGGAGNDTIYGFNGNDTITGGTGSDSLNGGSGNDTYVFNPGDGADTISDNSGDPADVLQFGTGITADTTQLSRSGNDLTFNLGASDQVTIKDYFNPNYTSNYRIETVAFADGTTWNVGTTVGKLTYNGTAGTDTMNGDGTYGNHINGLDGNDSISGGGAADALDGGAGNDTIYGFNGNDTITGGTGSDSLNGGSGNDTYVFNLGDGADTISDNSGDPADVLQFGTGITADTTQLSRSGNDLTFNLGASDQVTIKDYFNPNYTSNYRIETVAFADGTTWNVGTTVGKLTYNGTAGTDTMNGDGTYGNHINGLDGNDSISGGGAADALDGGAGNDTIYGFSGNDTITGGTGSDSLNGGSGNDTYVFNLGDGTDTISDNSGDPADVLQFGTGITADTTQLSRSGNDLTFNFGASDQVTIKDYFYPNYTSNYRIETVAFADGTTWNVGTTVGKLTYNGTAGTDTMNGDGTYGNHINGLDGNDSISGGGAADALDGGAGNDTIYGFNGNDTITGGTGSDSLNGGSGNDTYVFNLGDGADTISDNSGDPADVLQFGTGITADTTQLSRSGNDLTFNLGASDQVTIKDYFNPNYTSNYRIETVAFADGTTWNVGTTVGKLTYNGTAGTDTMNGDGTYGNHINGLDGNDSISGGGAADALDGGAGNDTIYGGSGNDTITGGTGSDALTGGSGNDVFRFINFNQGADNISDFISKTDVIQVLGTGFGLQAGNGIILRTGSSMPAPSGTDPQFLYNTTSGALYFDQDGEGTAHDAVQILTLIGQKTLVASDIVVVEM